MNDEMRNLLAEYLRTQAMTAKGMNFAPPGGPEGLNLPQMALKGGKNPTLEGEYEMPVGEGELSVRGGYRRKTSQDPAEWSAGVGYHRKF